MNTPRRGEMYAPEIATQQRDYSGLRIGNITPTDVDGEIDYKDKLWIIFELKRQGSEMPPGQKLALERQTDDLATLKPAICLIAEHNHEGVIDAANAIVTLYRWGGKWEVPQSRMTLRGAIDAFIEKHA